MKHQTHFMLQTQSLEAYRFAHFRPSIFTYENIMCATSPTLIMTKFSQMVDFNVKLCRNRSIFSRVYGP